MMRIEKAKYLLSGLTRRIGAHKACPSCASTQSNVVSRKAFHSLSECASCGLRFRFPTEQSAEMHEFYQEQYTQPGLTTDLPTPDELARLLDANFKGSGKDFSAAIRFLRALGVQDGARLLDYGSNWGYGAYQYAKAGFDTQAFEISKARAQYGENLGIEIATRLSDIEGDFDVCFSSHVLEHVPDPAASIQEQLDRTRKGGIVVATTPNGSAARHKADRYHFDKNWGQVHPVLLSDIFVKNVAGDQPYFITSGTNFPTSFSWSPNEQLVEDTSGSDLFFAIVKQ